MKRTVITDKRIDKKCEAGLLGLGYELVKVEPSPFLAPPVASHPDMLMFIGKGALVCERRYFEANADVVSLLARRGGLGLVLSDDTAESVYPRDVLFNAAAIGDKLICLPTAVSKDVLGLYQSENIVAVKQGYAKCSCLTVGDSGIITADPSVARAASACGIDVLRLREHHVALSGYGCGFIGGASGDDGEHILFCGSLDRHPEGGRIADFCRSHGREPISLSDGELYDYGSLLFV